MPRLRSRCRGREAGRSLLPFHANLSSDESATGNRLEVVLLDALQTLTLGLLIRQQRGYHGAVDIVYHLSLDGQAALAAGNAAEVLARRTPD